MRQTPFSRNDVGSMSRVVSTGVFRARLILDWRGWHRMRITAGRTAEARRFLCFTCGVLLASTFWVTPLAHLAHRSLTGHMVQHLLLMTVAAPLILSGEPALVLGYRMITQRVVGFFDRPFRHRSLNSEWRSSANLVLCWMAGTAVVIWWHIPSVFAFSMYSQAGHELEKATFLVGGILFWGPVLRQRAYSERRSPWAIVFYLFFGTLPCDALAAFLTFCGRNIYAVYSSGSESLQRLALLDQETAGALMWTWVTFVYLVPAVLIAISRLSGTRTTWECSGDHHCQTCH